MGSTYTSDQLLASIRRRGSLPDSSNSVGADSHLYALINDELQTYMVELLLDIDEEYLVATADTTTTAGTAAYDLPARAIGRKLRRLLTSADSDAFAELARIEPSDENSGYSGYKWQGDRIVLLQEPTSSYTLRFEYFQRPSKVVATSAVAVVSAINTSTKTVTTSATVPSTFSTSVTFDFVRAKPGFRNLAIDQTTTVCAGTTITFTDTLPTDLAVGDYVCLADESPVPQLPAECHPLLAQRVCFKALESIGDPKAAVTKAVADEMEERVIGVLSPRDEGASRYIKNRHAPGFGSSNYYRYRR
jgi:hypothetical protein